MADPWSLKMFPWSNQPRFYPPGKHPAMARWYDFLQRAEEIEAVTARGQDPNFDAALDYARAQIAAFEGFESELKAEAALRR